MLLRQALSAFPNQAPRAGSCSVPIPFFNPPPFKTARLLVEDTPVNREVALGMLICSRHFMCRQENGRLAVEAVMRNGSTILMDCQMPEMDGFTATAAIRQQEREAADHRHVPIIALTASVREGDRARCLAAGMDDYLANPFTLAQLKEISKMGNNTDEWWSTTEPTSPFGRQEELPADQALSPAPPKSIRRPGKRSGTSNGRTSGYSAKVLTAYSNDLPHRLRRSGRPSRARMRWPLQSSASFKVQ